ncbi:hypothetical protein CANARDRAFT_28471 [[Candida] arabinofermentans NRRL YB-2248]|uniref:Uncharacterized protein n=1 Tax=[Candida] arabinofermentans NRRL YB-2248 TaxID=983967 RepID=A0A1E4T0B6_9ASCO|nr:hypothetical protein CANARDRAFT_28471 [[Candida] arabinofermentans NRRL YB-2248]
MLDSGSYEALDSRLIELESRLNGVTTDKTIYKQLRTQLNEFQKILSSMKNSESHNKLIANLKSIGIYNELGLYQTSPPMDKSDGALTAADKKTLVELNLPSLERVLTSAEELLALSNSLNNLEIDHDKQLELIKLGSISEAQYKSIFQCYLELKSSYNSLIARSVKLLELNLLQISEQNNFYLFVESKLSSLESKLAMKKSDSKMNITE